MYFSIYGTSPKGDTCTSDICTSDFDFDLWDFSDRPNKNHITVNNMYKQTELLLLRFYLSSTSKTRHTAKMVFLICTQMSRKLKMLRYNLCRIMWFRSSFRKWWRYWGKRNSEGWAVITLRWGWLSSWSRAPGTNHLKFTAPHVKGIRLKLHQSHLLQKLFRACMETNPIQDAVSLEMVMMVPMKQQRMFVALSDNWSSIHDRCT